MPLEDMAGAHSDLAGRNTCDIGTVGDDYHGRFALRSDSSKSCIGSASAYLAGAEPEDLGWKHFLAYNFPACVPKKSIVTP